MVLSINRKGKCPVFIRFAKASGLCVFCCIPVKDCRKKCIYNPAEISDNEIKEMLKHSRYYYKGAVYYGKTRESHYLVIG